MKKNCKTEYVLIDNIKWVSACQINEVFVPMTPKQLAHHRAGGKYTTMFLKACMSASGGIMPISFTSQPCDNEVEDA